MADLNKEQEARTSYQEVAASLSYDSPTGVFTRLRGRDRGKRAGSPNQKGKVRIAVNGKRFLASRLAWLLFYGEWPTVTVDHINRIPDDDRICNLRLATNSEQQYNRDMQSNNTSGYKGVSYNKRRAAAGLPPWEAYVTAERERIHLGYFASAEEASLARDLEAQALHGEFAC